MVKNPPVNVGDRSSISRSGRLPREGHGNPLQYSCLENSMDRGDWQATVHRVAKSQTQLKQPSTQHTTYITLYSNYKSIKKGKKRERSNIDT